MKPPSINERLLANPAEEQEFRDDTEIQAFLLEVGIAGKFTKQSAHVLQAITNGDHPTHYLMVLFFSGKAKKEDNGYLLFCLPKQKLPPDQAYRTMESYARKWGSPVFATPYSAQGN